MSDTIYASSSLKSAIELNDVAEVKAIFTEEKYDVNQVFKFEVWDNFFGRFNYYQATLLDSVWRKGSDEMVDLVLEMGADASKISLHSVPWKRFLKYLPQLDKNGFDIIGRLLDIGHLHESDEHDVRKQLDALLVNIITNKNIDVNTVLTDGSSLLSFVLDRDMSNTVKWLLEKGARADEIEAHTYHGQKFLAHIPDLINAGFNLEKNFYKLRYSIADDKLSELIEQDIIKPEFKYIEVRGWDAVAEEKSLINFIINGQMKQAFLAMAKKGFKFDSDYALEYTIMHEQTLFYQENIMVLAEMGLNFTIPNNNRLLIDLKEEVLIDLISKDLLDVNLTFSDHGNNNLRILKWALEKGSQELVKILLEKGADASSIVMQILTFWHGYKDDTFKVFIENLDALMKNGLKLVDGSQLNNLEFILTSNYLAISSIGSLIDKGIITPKDVIAGMLNVRYSVADKFKSKELLDLLLEKGLSVHDKLHNGSEVYKAIIQLFSSEGVVPLFKNGTLNASSDEVILEMLQGGIKTELILALLKENLLSLDRKIDGKPLLVAFQRNSQIVDYLIKNGAFESLTPKERESFLNEMIIYNWDKVDEKINILETLKEKHGYELDESAFCAMLRINSKPLIKYALDNGIELNRKFSEDLPDVEGIKVAGLFPIQAAITLSFEIDDLNHYSGAGWKEIKKGDAVDVLIENGADTTVLTKEGYSIATLHLMYGINSGFNIDSFYEKGGKPHLLDALFPMENDRFGDYEKYFNEVDFNQLIDLPNKDSYPVFYTFHPKLIGVTTVSFLHILVRTDSMNNFNYLMIKRGGIDLNQKDSLGKTPIFYAQKLGVVEYLIANGAKTDVVDNNGNTLLHLTQDIDLLKVFSKHQIDHNAVNNQGQKWYDGKPLIQLIDNNLLPEWKSIPKITNLLLQNGEVLRADSYYKQGAHFAYDLKSDLVKSIKLGISASLEINKYQSLIAIFNKYAIQLPSFLYKYINDPQDYESTKELEMILSDQFLNQLVDQYLANLGVEHTSINEYSQYTTTMDKVVKRIEEDLALEVLAINKLNLVPLTEEHFVYRGLKLSDISGFIAHNFVHGHKALLISGVHNFGFHAQEPWSKNQKVGYSWEFAGIYASFSKDMAKNFASGGISQVANGGGVIMQIKIGPETKFVCGRNTHESEITTLSTIPVEAIKSITIVGTGQVIQNEHYIESALDRVELLTEEQMIANYKAMGCEQYVDSNKAKLENGGELSPYEKFIETFTPAELAAHRNKVYLAAEQTEMCLAD